MTHSSFQKKLSIFIKKKLAFFSSVFLSKNTSSKLKINPIYQETENGALRFSPKHYKNSESEKRDEKEYQFFKNNPELFANRGRHNRLGYDSRSHRRQRQRSRDRNRR